MGLGASDGFGQRGQHDLRHRQAERTADLAGDELGDQRLLAVAGAPELDDVLALVIGLHEGREGTSLPERRDVARDLDGAQHAARV